MYAKDHRKPVKCFLRPPPPPPPNKFCSFHWASVNFGDGPLVNQEPHLHKSNNSVCFFFLRAAPSGPQTLRVTKTPGPALTVTWYPPLDLNGILTLYTMTYRPTAGGEPKTRSVPVQTSNPQTVVLTDVQRNVHYTVEVRASTSAGEGPPVIGGMTAPSEYMGSTFAEFWAKFLKICLKSVGRRIYSEKSYWAFFWWSVIPLPW